MNTGWAIGIIPVTRKHRMSETNFPRAMTPQGYYAPYSRKEKNAVKWTFRKK